jgi:hypothetical protein
VGNRQPHTEDEESVYLSFQNNKIKVMASDKCCANFEYFAIMNVQ